MLFGGSKRPRCTRKSVVRCCSSQNVPSDHASLYIWANFMCCIRTESFSATFPAMLFKAFATTDLFLVLFGFFLCSSGLAFETLSCVKSILFFTYLLGFCSHYSLRWSALVAHSAEHEPHSLIRPPLSCHFQPDMHRMFAFVDNLLNYFIRFHCTYFGLRHGVRVRSSGQTQIEMLGKH